MFISSVKRVVFSSIPMLVTPFLAASIASSSISIRVADFAPANISPIPSIPFPDPKSTTSVSSVKSPLSEIAAIHLAAKSPSVTYCSSSGDCFGSLDNAIAKRRNSPAMNLGVAHMKSNHAQI